MPTKICEFCDTPFEIFTNHFFCTHCDKLNFFSDNIDYFTYLNIKQSYPVDKPSLESHYIELFSLYHPDNFVTHSAQEQANALKHSSLLNQAYSCLKSNTNLAKYIYELCTGENLDEHNDSSNKIAILFFELNEELERISTIEEISRFKNRLDQVYSKINADISEAVTNKTFHKIKDLYNQLKYIESIQSRYS